jgi:hypothetical protein
MEKNQFFYFFQDLVFDYYCSDNVPKLCNALLQHIQLIDKAQPPSEVNK